jgi:hypothetical protein
MMRMTFDNSPPTPSLLKNRGGKPQRKLKSEANKKLQFKNNSTLLPISNEVRNLFSK